MNESVGGFWGLHEGLHGYFADGFLPHKQNAALTQDVTTGTEEPGQGGKWRWYHDNIVTECFCIIIDYFYSQPWLYSMSDFQ